jgi:methionine-rich copper-binding protein CopC
MWRTPALNQGRGYTMKKIFASLATIAILLSSTESAVAHAQIITTVPKSNSTIRTLPTFVYIDFDGNLLDFAEGINSIQVTDSKGKRVDTKKNLLGGSRLSTTLKSGIKPGKYKVSYRIVSEDGHPVNGSFSFTYK